MEVKLNPNVFNAEALQAKGLNASAVAKSLGVSRECVSKWLGGESLPKPDKLLALGVLLGVAYGELVVRFGDVATPVVNFRRKQNRVQDAEDEQACDAFATFIQQVSRYSQAGSGLTIAPLSNPRSDYDYAAMAADFFRRQLNLPQKIESRDLVRWFKLFGINLIPAFWGDKQYYGNALRVSLPKGATWVVLNLDSKVCDFLFWMAHEIGHSIAPGLEGSESEKFADNFANALLFPPLEADALYARLPSLRGAAVGAIVRKAKEWNVSPYTVLTALRFAEKRHGKDNKSSLPPDGAVMAAARRSADDTTVAERVFGKGMPSPEEFVKQGEQWLMTEFFAALAAYLVKLGLDNMPIGSVAHLLGLSPDDAYGLIMYLSKRG